jgi:hypothetical protein
MTKALKTRSDIVVEDVHNSSDNRKLSLASILTNLDTGFAFAQEPGQLEAMRVTTIRVLKENKGTKPTTQSATKPTAQSATKGKETSKVSSSNL